MGPHDEFIKGQTKRNSVNNRKTEAGFFTAGLGEEEKIGDRQENNAIGKVVNMIATDGEKEIGSKKGRSTRNGKSDKERNENEKRDFFAGFGFDEI